MANSRFDIPTIYANLVKQVTDIIAEVKSKDISDNLEYMAWDSRGDVTELPDIDLIGLADWAYDETDDHRPEIEFAVVVPIDESEGASIVRVIESTGSREFVKFSSATI